MTKSKKSSGKNKEPQGQDNSKASKKSADDVNGVNQGSKMKVIPKASNSNTTQSSNRSQTQPKSQTRPKSQTQPKCAKQPKSKAKNSSSSSIGICLGLGGIILLSIIVAGFAIYLNKDAQVVAGNVYNDHVGPIVGKIRRFVDDFLEAKPSQQPTASQNDIPPSNEVNNNEKDIRDEEEERQRIEKDEKDRIEREKKDIEEQLRRKEREEAEKRAEQERKEAEERKVKEKEKVMKKERERKEAEEKKRIEREQAEKKAEQERKEKEKREAEEKMRKEKEEAEKKEKQRKEEEERKRQEKTEQERKEKERKRKEEEEEAEQKAELEKKVKERKLEEERKRKEMEEQEKKEKEKNEERKRNEMEEHERKAEQERKEKERKEDEERKRKDKEEAERKAEQDKKEKERKLEEERKRKEMEEQDRKAEQERREKERKEDEERKRKEKEEAEKKAEQEIKEKERKLKAEQERKDKEEAQRKAEQERKEKGKKLEEERKRKENEEKERKELEDRKKKEKEEAVKKPEQEKKAKEATQKQTEAAAKKGNESRTSKTEEPYEFASITNANDMTIKDELDEADRLYDDDDYEEAIRRYDSILTKHQSPRAMYGKSLTLDKLGFKHRSNEYLEEAINFLGRFLLMPDAPDELFLMGGRKLAERQHFRGWGSKAVKTFTLMIERFPEDVKLRSELGVTYMMIGRNKDAKEIFEQVLQFDPDNGFAKAHIGFIIKTKENDLEKAIPLLRDGIASGEEGTDDGRFYVHLGDALLRLGQDEEARHHFKEAETKGLFLSQWQRSLYNIKTLTARPYWTAKQLGYEKDIELLEKNWKTIRDEGLAQLDEKTGSFMPEDENLRDTGEWKQFTLYQQGRKNHENCAKVPKTCAIIDQIPAAKDCKRGQVKFSVMSPGIHVWPHTGPTNCRLRSHLGLIVPDGPLLRVVNETRTWKEGKVMTFDDSFEHEVWHKGSELRLILIVDFWHPELTERQRRTLSPI